MIKFSYLYHKQHRKPMQVMAIHKILYPIYAQIWYHKFLMLF